MQNVKTYNELPSEYWNFVCDHLPNYSEREDVSRSNTLTNYVLGRKITEEDLDWLPKDKEEAGRMVDELDLKLYNEAVDAYNEKMKSYHYRLHLFREEVLEKLMEVLNGQHIDVSGYEVSVSVRGHYTGQAQTDMLTKLECTRFKTTHSEESIHYSQMDIADLCAILDNLTIGEWKHLVVKQ